MTFRHVLLAACLLAASPLCLAQHATPHASGAEAAATEAHQFDFLVGEWVLEVKPKVSSLAAMMHGSPRLVGSWSAQRAFDGRGIEDTLRIVDASGNPTSLNRALRVWSPTERKWLVTSVDGYRARISSATASWTDGEMHAASSGIDAEGKPYRTRTRFHDISPDGFTMTQDRSSDGGESWDEGVLEIVATRAGSEP